MKFSYLSLLIYIYQRRKQYEQKIKKFKLTPPRPQRGNLTHVIFFLYSICIYSLCFVIQGYRQIECNKIVCVKIKLNKYFQNVALIDKQKKERFLI